MAVKVTGSTGKKKPMRKLKPAKKVKRDIKRVPPTISGKKTSPRAAVAETVSSTSSDPAAAMAFAMSIAKEKKLSAAKDDERRNGSEIHLTRRPTTRVQGKATEKFQASDLKEFRKRLLETRESVLSGVGAMRETGFNESDDHEVDGGDGTTQTMRLQALGQVEQLHRIVQQIEEALHRIDDGSYGVCKVCGQLIRKPRLLNQPFVLTCMECQNAMERTKG